MEKSEEKVVDESTEIIKEELDEAIGEISSPFISNDSINSDIGRDGSVDKKPDDDLVTQIAKQGEYRMHWALMVTMISVYSIIGIIVGTTLKTDYCFDWFACPLNIWFLVRWNMDSKNRNAYSWSDLGYYLNEITLWPCIRFTSLGWLDNFGTDADVILGSILLLLVGFNVFIAHWHNSDAIAVQATLILMVVASGASTASNEIGIDSGLLLALLLLVATLLLHGLAIMRKSGNLAAMGIVASIYGLVYMLYRIIGLYLDWS